MNDSTHRAGHGSDSFSLTVHIISHTHWDREWFLESRYTNPWLPEFFERLFSLLEADPGYRFVLDGQMLVVEDWLDQLPKNERVAAEALLGKYASEGRLLLGPYWAAVDWKNVGAESLVRNIVLGCREALRYGPPMKTGWLVDGFGQVGQTAQLHQLAGIDAIFVWRGVEFPADAVRSEFTWRGPDGSEVLAVYLFDSYRNLMGLTRYPDIAGPRVANQVDKMRPFLTGPNVLLMNGYDLDPCPENPLSVLEEPLYRTVQATPDSYVQSVRESGADLPVLHGELLSGRYLSVFPGTLSSRVYLKLWNRRCEDLLTKVVEPLGCMNWYEVGLSPQSEIAACWKELIANQCHDNIAGVCVDPVHREMEKRYHRLVQRLEALRDESLASICSRFSAGITMAFNTNPFPVTLPVEAGDEVVLLDEVPAMGCRSTGSCARYAVTRAYEKLSDFAWQNDHYVATVNDDGTVDIRETISGAVYRRLGFFHDEGDAGDEYNHSPPGKDRVVTSCGRPATIRLVYRTPAAARVRVKTAMPVPRALDGDDRSAATVPLAIEYDLLFDTTPLIRYRIAVTNTARDHRLKMVFPTDMPGQRIVAEMPFEFAARPESVDNSRPIPSALEPVLRGARECTREFSFPMNDFVAVSDERQTFAVMTLGLREYEVRDGTLFVTLLRSVGWLARTDLRTRLGDAGPLMYTPGAQCLRELQYDIGILAAAGPLEITALPRWVQMFHNPPFLVQIRQSPGHESEGFSLPVPELPDCKLTALKVADSGDGFVARFYNPWTVPKTVTLPAGMAGLWKTDLLERPLADLSSGALEIAPGEIVSIKLTPRSGDVHHSRPAKARAAVLVLSPQSAPPTGEEFRDTVGKGALESLKEQVRDLSAQLEIAKERMEKAQGLDYHRAFFDYLCLKRTCLEVRLSVLQNRKHLAPPQEAERIRREIASIGRELNDCRIERRMYEYVLDCWQETP